MLKRFSWFLAIALVMSVFLSACSKSSTATETEKPSTAPAESSSASTEAPAAAALDTTQQLTIKWQIPTQQKTGLATSVAMVAIAKKFNVKFDFIETTTANNAHEEKNKLTIASQDIPDLMTWIHKDDGNKYGEAGAFKELTPYLDKLPEVKKRLDSDPNGKYNAYTADGKLYRIPDFNMMIVPIFDFSYNKDEFAAVGFPEPKTWDEVYDALKKLKEKYPDSYPLSARGKEIGTNGFRSMFLQSFTEGLNGGFDQAPGFDPVNKKWIYGPEAPGYKEAIQYLNKLYSEKLLDPEFITLDMDNLQAKIKNKKTFMLDDYVGGLSGIESLNPGGVLKPLPIPVSAGKKQVLGLKGAQIGDRGTIISAKLDGPKLDRVLAIMNYLYSDEFYNFFYWNPDTTIEKDGKKMYQDFMYDATNPKLEEYFPWAIYGSFLVNLETITKPGTPYADYKANVLTAPGNADKYNPLPVLPFTGDQSKQITQLAAAVDDYWKANIDSFIVGKKSFDQWDAFVAEAKKKGGDEEVKIYNDVYTKYFGQ